MTWFITASWRVIAASSTGWPCPWTAVHQDAIASRTRISAAVADQGQPGAVGADGHHRRHRLGADRAVGMPDVRGVDRADLLRGQRRHAVESLVQLGRSGPACVCSMPTRARVGGSLEMRDVAGLGRLTVDHVDPHPDPPVGTDRRGFSSACRDRSAEIGALPPRPRRATRSRDRPRGGVPRVVRAGLGRCRRLPGAVRFLLRRFAAAHRAEAGIVAVAVARDPPPGPPAASRARRGACRRRGAHHPGPAADPLGDVC